MDPESPVYQPVNASLTDLLKLQNIPDHCLQQNTFFFYQIYGTPYIYRERELRNVENIWFLLISFILFTSTLPLNICIRIGLLNLIVISIIISKCICITIISGHKINKKILVCKFEFLTKYQQKLL